MRESRKLHCKPFPIFSSLGAPAKRPFDWSETYCLCYFIQVTIRNAIVHDAKFNKGLYIKYKPFQETEYTTTKVVTNTLTPEFNHSQVFHFDKVTDSILEWFESGCITFQLYGRQEDSDPDATRTRMTTKVLQLNYLQIVCLQELLLFGKTKANRNLACARFPAPVSHFPLA